MPTIRALLNEFGRPPPGVAMDWTYQIRSASQIAAAAHAESANKQAENRSSADSDWTSLEVDADGLLDLNSLNFAMAQEALIALDQWSKKSDQPAHSVQAHETLVPHRTHSAPTQRKTSRPNSLAIPALAVSTVLLLCALLIYAVRDASTNTPAKALSTLSQQHPLNDPSTLDESFSAGTDALRTANDSSLQQSTDQPANTLVQSDTKLGVTPLQHPLDALRISASLRPPEAAAEAAAGASKPTTDTQGGTVFPNVAAHVTASSSTEGNSAMALPDVMQQVAAALAAAASQSAHAGAGNSSARDAASDPSAWHSEATVAQDLKVSSDVLRQPTLILTREMTNHHYELPRAWLRRPREPHWSVAIEASEGFAIEPATPQELPSRSHATWRIIDEQAKSPRAYLIVNFINRGKREAGLDCQVRGGAEDLPQLQLPLARKWLDPLAAQLQLSSRQLRAQLENTQPNAPAALRQFSREQRRLANEQHLLADRMLAIIADVDRLATLIDGEIICSATLRSQAGGKALFAYGEMDE